MKRLHDADAPLASTIAAVFLARFEHQAAPAAPDRTGRMMRRPDFTAAVARRPDARQRHEPMALFSRGARR